MAIKISSSVWDKLNDSEREFIIKFADAYGLQYCKEMISQAKKRFKRENIIGYPSLMVVHAFNEKQIPLFYKYYPDMKDTKHAFKELTNNIKSF